MAIKPQQLRQIFLISGPALAVLLVLFVAWFTSSGVGRALEQAELRRAGDVTNHAAFLLTQYLRAQPGSATPERLTTFLGDNRLEVRDRTANPEASELFVSAPIGDSRLWVVYHQPKATAFAVAHRTQRAIWLGALFVAAS